MPKVLFGLADQNVDPSEYRDGMCPSVRDCYQVQKGDQHFRKRKGLTAFADTGTASATQGSYESFGGKIITVIGGIVYDVSSTGTLTAYTGATLNSGTQCTFAEDFYNVFVAHGGYLAQLDTAAKTVTLLGATSPHDVTHVSYAQGYLLCNGIGASSPMAGDTYYSDDQVNGYVTWEVFNNERLPDGCTSLLTGWDAEVYAFGPQSIEVSYNDGTTPWAVLQGAYVQYGTLAAYSPVIADNSIFWLAEIDGSRRIVRMVGRAPSIISTPYDRLINSFTTVSDAKAWLHQLDGFTFYVITFPSEGVTLAYKLDDGTWSEFGYWNTSTASYENYRGHNALYVRSLNKLLVGDRESGKVYEQGGTSDNGEIIRYELTSGQNENGTFARKKEGYLLFRVKKGYAEGGSFGYRVRDNNGPWKNEKTVSLGSLGSTNPYVKVLSGGVFRSRQYQIIHSDIDIDFIFMGLEN
jgi:hypothetical protein